MCGNLSQNYYKIESNILERQHEIVQINKYKKNRKRI